MSRVVHTSTRRVKQRLEVPRGVSVSGAYHAAAVTQRVIDPPRTPSLLFLSMRRCAGLVSGLTPRLDPQFVSAEASHKPDDRHDHDDAE